MNDTKNELASAQAASAEPVADAGLRKAVRQALSGWNELASALPQDDRIESLEWGAMHALRNALTTPAPAVAPDAVTDDELRKMWRDAGGRFHGPHAETGTMPESLLLPFLRNLATRTTEPAVTDELLPRWNIERADRMHIKVWSDSVGGYLAGANPDDNIASVVLYHIAESILEARANRTPEPAEVTEAMVEAACERNSRALLAGLTSHTAMRRALDAALATRTPEPQAERNATLEQK